MIAEYERAQILERSRRGKRHRARGGQVSVLSGAPFGYCYVRKTDQMAAYYAVIEAEAQIVRSVFERYTAQGLSIGAIACLLNEERVATRRANRALGAVGDMGNAAQSCLQGHGVLRQDTEGATAAHHAAASVARRLCHARQWTA